MRGSAAAVVTLGILILFGSFTVEAATRSFSVEMLNVQFSLEEIRVEWGDEVTIHVQNNDTGVPAGHTFEIMEYDIHLGTRNDPLPPGAQDSTTFTANQNGTFWYFCSVPGHASQLADGYAGMAGRLIVGDGPDGNGPDWTLAIIIGVVAAAVALGVAVYFIRRK